MSNEVKNIAQSRPVFIREMIEAGGYITISGNALTRWAAVNEKILLPEIFDGNINWGYGGSAPQRFAKGLIRLFYPESKLNERLYNDLMQIFISQLPDKNFTVLFNMGAFIYFTSIRKAKKPLLAYQFSQNLLEGKNSFISFLIDFPNFKEIGRYKFYEGTLEFEEIHSLSRKLFLKYKLYLHDFAKKLLNPLDVESESESLQIELIPRSDAEPSHYIVEYPSDRVKNTSYTFGWQKLDVGNFSEVNLEEVEKFLNGEKK